jgi:transaldolase
MCLELDRQVLDMTDRPQLNVRFDGKKELLASIKEVAAAEGLTVSAWVIRALEQAMANPTPPQSQPTAQAPALEEIEPLLDSKLDAMLDEKLKAQFATFEQRLEGRLEERLREALPGKLRA